MVTRSGSIDTSLGVYASFSVRQRFEERGPALPSPTSGGPARRGPAARPLDRGGPARFSLPAAGLTDRAGSAPQTAGLRLSRPPVTGRAALALPALTAPLP